MKRIFKIWVFTFVFFSFTTSFVNGKKSTEHVPLFNDGETVVFFGNSITHGGTYHSFINLFYQTRYPEKNIKMINCGISGNELPGGIARLETDVLVHNPDVIVMMFGMNDSRVDGITEADNEQHKLQKLRARIDYYKQNLDSVSEIISSKGIRIIYIAPTIYDDKVEVEAPVRYGGNKALGMCREMVYETAGKYGFPVVDFYTIMNDINKRYQKIDPTFTVVGADRVHPGKEGHLLMACQFMKTQGVRSLVSAISLDASELSVLTRENCEVASFSNEEGLITFSAKSDALPFPVSDNEAINWIPVMDELNQEMLQVKGLKEGDYVLSVDNMFIADFSARELAKGINLATFSNTPQYQQALLVSELNDMRTTLVRDRIRSLAFFDYGWFNNMPKDQPLGTVAEFFKKELSKIEDKSYYPYVKDQTKNYLIYRPQLEETKDAIERIEEAMRRTAQPVWHKYQLKFQKK